jgi:hypothetical protein
VEIAVQAAAVMAEVKAPATRVSLVPKCRMQEEGQAAGLCEPASCCPLAAGG